MSRCSTVFVKQIKYYWEIKAFSKEGRTYIVIVDHGLVTWPHSESCHPQDHPGRIIVPRGAVGSRKDVHEVRSLLLVGLSERFNYRSKTRPEL